MQARATLAETAQVKTDTKDVTIDATHCADMDGQCIKVMGAKPGAPNAFATPTSQ